MTVKQYAFSLSPFIFSMVLLLSPLSMSVSGDKPMLFHLTLLIFLVLLIAQQYFAGFRQTLLVPIEMPVRFYAAFIVFAFLSLLWSISSISSLMTAITFFSGLMALILVYNWSQQQAQLYYSFLIIVVLIIAGITVYQAFFLNMPVDLFSGLFKDRNTHAAFMVMLLIPICCQFLNKELNAQFSIYLSLLIIFISFAIALTGSRGAILSLVIDFLLLTALFLIHKQKKTLTAVLKLAAFLIVGVILSTVFLKQGIVARVLDSEVQVVFAQNTGRGGLWLSAWKMFLDHPVFGWGIGTFFLLFPQYKPPLNTELGLFAHNDYLQFLLELGVIGLFLFLGFIITSLIIAGRFAKQACHPEQKYALSLLIASFGMLVHTAFNFNLYQMSIQLLMGGYIGRFLLASNLKPYAFIPMEKTTAKSYYGLITLIILVFIIRFSTLGAFFYFGNLSNKEGNTRQAVETMEIANIFYPHTGIYETKKAVFAISRLGHLSPEDMQIVNTEILHDLNIAIKKNPINAFTYANRAKVLTNLDSVFNKDKIIADYEQAIKINPADLAVRNSYALYLGKQQAGKALSVLWAGWDRVYILSAVTYQEMLKYLQLLQDYNTQYGNVGQNVKIIKVKNHLLDLIKKSQEDFVYFQ